MSEIENRSLIGDCSGCSSSDNVYDSVAGNKPNNRWSEIGATSGSTNDHGTGIQPNMSFCIATAYSNQVYFAVDSRSSILRTETRLGDVRIASHILSDNFQKLFYAQGVVIVITGADTFLPAPNGERKMFADILKSISFQTCDNPKKVIELIVDALSAMYTFKLETTHAFFFYFDKDNVLHRLKLTSTEKKENFLKEENFVLSAPPSENHFCYFMCGVGWAQELAKYFPFSTSSDDKTACEKLNRLMNRISTVSELFDNSVGGTIRIAKLTPDGFTWLQGEPT